MATKQMKGEWKITNRGRYSWKRQIRMKQRKGKEWYIAHDGYGPKENMHVYHYIPETITRIVLRRQQVPLSEAPEEVRNEIMLWKMSQK